jgi:hypothetical protein
MHFERAEERLRASSPGTPPAPPAGQPGPHVATDAASLVRASSRVTPLGPPAGQPGPHVASDAASIRAYEELEGAEGRAVFFRPHRHRAADLAPLRCIVVLLADGSAHECALQNVSQNGVAFAWPRGLPVAGRQHIDVAVRFDDHEAFRGRVTVGSVREKDGTIVVGVSFDDFLLDMEEVLELRSIQAWRTSGASARMKELPWALAGHDRYKSLVADLRLRLDDTRRELDLLEARLPWHVLHGDENAARAAIVGQLRDDFVPDVLELSEAIDGAVREVPGAYGSAAAKEWSRRHVDDFLMQSPGLHRARHKPFGYPGDYELMNFMYGDEFVGSTLFARAVQLAFNQTRAAQAVRCRKDLVKSELKALLTRRPHARRPIRILSIAAGPARELVELFQDLGPLPVPVEIVLFEQERNALAHAWRRLQAVGAMRRPGPLRVTFLHDSIKRLLRDETLFAQFGKFDVVYTCGLYDYLQQRTAVVLTRRLAAATAQGGRLLVANMVDHPTRWLMDFHLEWLLVYRTREELLDIGARAVPGASLRIIEEQSRANPFLELIRPC